MSRYRRFAKDESGAVLADWVVLTASVVIISVGAINFAFKDAVLAVVDETAGWVEAAMPEVSVPAD